jgi:hypothetical protein
VVDVVSVVVVSGCVVGPVLSAVVRLAVSPAGVVRAVAVGCERSPSWSDVTLDADAVVGFEA